MPTLPDSLIDLTDEIALPADITLAAIVPGVDGTPLDSMWLQNARVAPADGGGVRITADLPDMYLTGVTLEIPAACDRVRVGWHAAAPLQFPDVDWLAFADAALTLDAAAGRLRGEFGGTLHVGALALPLAVGLPPPDSGWVLAPTFDRISVADVAGFAATLGVPDVTAMLPADLAAALDRVAITGLRLHYQPFGRAFKAFAVDLEIDTTWTLVPNLLAVERPTLALSVRDPASRTSRKVTRRLSAVLQLGALRLPVSVTSEAGAHTLEIEADDIPVPRLADLVALVGPPVELPVDLPALRLSDVSIGVDAQKKAHLTLTVTAELDGKLPGFPAVGMSGFVGSLAVDAGVVTGSLAGGLTLGAASLDLLLERPAADAPWTFSARSRQGSGPLDLSAALSSLMSGVGLPPALPDLGLGNLALTVTPKLGAFALSADVVAAWTVPLGLAELTIADVRVAMARVGAGQPATCKLGGKLQLGGLALPIATSTDNPTLVANAGGLRPWSVIESLCGAVFDGIPVPEPLRTLVLDPCTVTIDPAARTLAIRGAAAGYGAIELHIRRDAQGAWGVAMALAPAGGVDLEALLSIPGLQGLALTDLVFVLSSLHAPALRFAAPQFAAVTGVTRGFGLATRIGLAELGVGQIPGMPTAPLAVQARFGRSLADFSLAAAMSAPGGRFIVDRPSGLALVDPELRLAPATGEVVIGGRVDVVLGGERLEFTGGFKMAGGVALFASMKGDWREPFGLRGVVARALSVELKFPPGVPSLSGTLAIGGRSGTLTIKPDPTAPVLDLWLEALDLSDVLGSIADVALADVPADVRRTISDVRFADVRVFIAPRATTLGGIDHPAGVSVRGKMIAWGLDVAAKVETRVVSSRKALHAEGAATLPALGDHLKIRNPIFKLDLEPGKIPEVVLDAAVEVLGLTVAAARVRLDDRGFAITLQGALFNNLSATIEVRGAGFSPTASYGVTATLAVGFLQDLLGEAVRKLDAVVTDAGTEIKKARDLLTDLEKKGQAMDAASDARRQQIQTARDADAKKLRDAEAALQAASARVDVLRREVDAARATVAAERAVVEARINAARADVNAARATVHGLTGEINATNKWFYGLPKVAWPWLASQAREGAWYGLKIGGLYAAREAASGVLAVADQALAAVIAAQRSFDPDLDPRIAGLLLARAAAQGVLTAAEQAVVTARSNISLIPVDADFRLLSLRSAREALNIQMVAARTALDLAEGALKGIETLGKALLPSVRIDRAGFACDLSVAAGRRVRMTVDATTHTGPRSFAVDLDLDQPLRCALELINVLLGTDGRAAVAAVAQNNAATATNVKAIERGALPNGNVVLLKCLHSGRYLAARPRPLRFGDTVTLRTTSNHHLREINTGVDAWQNHDSGPECAWTILNADVAGSTEPIRYGDAVALRSQRSTYLVAEGDGRTVRADRPAVGPWEHWTLVLPSDPASRALVDTGRELALRSYHGRYLQAYDDGFNGGRIYADPAAIGEWESWLLTPRTTGTIVATDGANIYDPECQFTLQRTDDCISLRSRRTGGYVSVGPDLAVTADATTFAGPGDARQRFTLEGDYLVNQATGRWLRRGDGDAVAMERIFGSLKYVECAADGAVWGVNTDDDIFRWRPSGGWDQIPGKLRQISVGSATQVWGVNAGGNIYRWSGTTWLGVPGVLRHVSVAADGTVWGSNYTDDVYRWNGASWTGVPGSVRQISVGSATQVWVVTSANTVYRWNGGSWSQHPGLLIHVSVAADGTLCGVNPRSELVRWTGNDWRVIGTGTRQVGVSSANLLWRTTTDFQIDRTDLRGLPGDFADGAATTRDTRAALEIAQMPGPSNQLVQNPGPPQYSAGDVQLANAQKSAAASGAAPGAVPDAEQAAATEANAARTTGDTSVAPVLSSDAAAEADRRARRQRTLEKPATAAERDDTVRDSALRFDGASYLEPPTTRPTLVDGVVGTAPTIVLGARFTVEAWILPERLGVEQAIVAKWSDDLEAEFLLSLAADGRLQTAWHVLGADTWATPGWTNLATPEAVKQDAWTHVAVIRDGDRIALHIDGRELASATGLGGAALRVGQGAWRIAASAPNRRTFAGVIDSVRIWGLALTPAALRARRFLVARGNEDGLLACWNMDEASGDLTFDSARSELHARLVGPVLRARPGGPEGPPLTDRHLTLAGAGRVHLGDVDLFAASTTLTLEAWILVDSVPGELAAIVDKWTATADADYHLSIAPDGRLVFGWRCQASTDLGTPGWNTLSSAGAVPFGRWSHVAVVRDGKWIRFFRDGAPIGAREAATDQPLRRSTTPLCLGSENGARNFAGSLAEVRAWTTARTEAAIRETHRRPLTGDEPGLAALWRLDEGTTTSIRDAGPAARHGALTGAATWPARGGPPRIVGPTRAMRFTGAQHLEFGDDDLFTASIAITIETWVRLDALTEELTALVNKWAGDLDDEYLLAIARDGRLLFGWHTQASNTYHTPGYDHIVSTGTVALDRWTHVAVVRAGRTVTFYIDGAPAGSFDAADLEPLRNGAAPLRIGAHGSGWGRHLRGDLAGVRIWRSARTPEQLAASMSGLVSSRAPGRVLDLRFDEQGGTVVHDAANGKLGAATGTPLPSNIPVILPVRTPTAPAIDADLDPRRPALDAARRCRSAARPATVAIPEITAALAQIERATPGAVIAVLAAAGYPADELGAACISVLSHTPATVIAAFFAGERPAHDALQAVAGLPEGLFLTLATAAGYTPEALGVALVRVNPRSPAAVAQLYKDVGLPGAHAARATAAALSVHATPSPAALARLLLATQSPTTIGEALTRLWDADASTITRAMQRAGSDNATALAATRTASLPLLARTLTPARVLGLASVAAAPAPQPTSPTDAATYWPPTAKLVPGNFTGAGARTELLVYDAPRGTWSLHARSDAGFIPLFAPRPGWRTTWNITPLRAPGSAQTHVLLHDASNGQVMVVRWNPATSAMDAVSPLMTGASRTLQFASGEFSDGGTLLCYDPVAGTGTVLGLHPSLGLASRGPLRTGWSRGAQVVPVQVLGHPTTCFLVYARDEGVARVFRWDPALGEVPVGPRMTGWRTTWTILPSHEHRDDGALLLHDTTTGELYCFNFTLVDGAATMRPAWPLTNGTTAGPATLAGQPLLVRHPQPIPGDFAATGRELYLRPTQVRLQLVDSKHNLALVAGDVADNNVYHQPPAGRTNAVWTLEPVHPDKPDVFRVRDAKHGKYLVAGDTYDQHVYHQDHEDRPNAEWKLVRVQDPQGRELYQLFDLKHAKALVAGDIADTHVYHQDPQGRANALWQLLLAPA